MRRGEGQHGVQIVRPRHRGPIEPLRTQGDRITARASIGVCIFVAVAFGIPVIGMLFRMMGEGL